MADIERHFEQILKWIKMSSYWSKITFNLKQQSQAKNSFLHPDLHKNHLFYNSSYWQLDIILGTVTFQEIKFPVYSFIHFVIVVSDFSSVIFWILVSKLFAYPLQKCSLMD